MMTSSQNLGKELQTRREQLGFSLQDVAKQTRIRKVYLESMEQGQLEDLPGQAYITGFIRVYARHLGMDSDALLALLDGSQEIENAEAELSASDCDPQLISGPQPSADKGWWAFVIGFIVVIALGSLFYYLPSFFKSDVPDRSSLEEVVKAQDPAIQQRTDLVTDTKPDSEPSVESAPEPVVAAAIDSVVEKKPIQDLFPTVPPAGSSLRMLALSESSLIIYVDDRKPNEYKLYEGLDLSWPIKKSVKVELGKPGAAQFWLGGQELPLGDSGSFQLKPASGE